MEVVIMEVRKSPFTTYKRRTAKKNRNTYYVRFFNPATGETLPGKSSRCTTKSEAIRWAIKQLEAGTAFTRSRREESRVFADFLSDFWKDDGRYASRYAETHDQPMSARYLYNNRRIIESTVLPILTAWKKTKLPLSDVTPEVIENIIMTVRKKGVSARTANTVRQAVTVPLAEAYRLGLIRTNPGAVVLKLREKTPERETFTIGEWRALVGGEWTDDRYKLAVILSATAGLRIGEVRGLMPDALTEETHTEQGEDGKPAEVTEYVVSVARNWQDGDGLKPPKTGSTRKVNISHALYESLRTLSARNPHGAGFVFWNAKNADTPVGQKMIELAFNDAVCRVLIEKYRAEGLPQEEAERRAEAERVKRGLTFHGLRHFFDRSLDGKISGESRRKLAGHGSDKMDRRYLSRIASPEERRLARLAITESLGKPAS